MNELSERFAARDVGSLFLYTHEAHPAEHYPHLTSMEQKLRHARDLRDGLGVTRPILVDSLDGACHRAYGSMPNMTWIFDRQGTVFYKSDWTDSRSVADALEMLLGVPARRRAGERAVPFRVQRIEYRSADREAFFRGLERSGPKAVREFRAAFGG
jgi:hypothetical protein